MSIDYSKGSQLYWESTYEIVLSLKTLFPDVNVETVGTEELRNWIIQLPSFVDDPVLANEKILLEILREWYEETISYG